MAIQVPFSDAPDFQFEISLDRVVYLMRLRWNHIAGSWGLDLMTRGREPLVFGARLEPQVPLLASHVGLSLPPGELYVFGDPEAYDAFTTGAAQLLYYSGEEMNALR